MHLLLFVLYGVILCYLLRRMRFFRDSGIRPGILILLFGFRVAAGCLHNFVAYRYYPNHGDIWAFFDVSFVTRHELFFDFHQFLADNAIWAYLPYNIVIFLHILFNVLSFGNMYINTLFFCFIVFAGSIALFRAFSGLFRDDLLSAVCALLIPSTLYWTACIHKEGLIYLSLGFFFYHLSRALHQGWDRKRVLLCLFFFGLAAFFRPAIAITLSAGLILWVIIDLYHRSRRSGESSMLLTHNQAWVAFGTFLVAIWRLWIAYPAWFSSILSYISRQQIDFQLLRGNSRIPLPILEPNPGSFLHTLPTALLNGFLEPLPGSGGQSIYLVFSVEMILIWSIIVYALLSFLLRRPGPPDSFRFSHLLQPGISDLSPHPRPTGLICCSLLFSFLGLLLIGYIIPFAGAIVRYRSLYLPFLLAPFLHLLRDRPFFHRVNGLLGSLVMDKSPC